MIAGLLNDRVRLMQPTVVTDGFGAETTGYTVYRCAHAEVRWKSGGTSNEVSELFTDGRIEVIVRDAHPVTDKWRLVYAGDLYHVCAVEHNRHKGFKRLLCEKVNE